MKHAALIAVLCVILGGCARKSDLDQARAELAEAQRKIAQLETERVPRAQYDIARASLHIADERISTLEKNLNTAYDLIASQQIPLTPEVAANAPAPSAPQSTPPPPNNFRLANGSYATANDTHVYSADSEIEFGQHLKVSSPTGLLVTDPDLRVVGGDLAVKAKGMTMTSEDGLLLSNNDGTVKFVGTNLTMKFDEKKEAPNQPAEATSPAAPTAPASSQTAPVAANSNSQ